MRIISLTSLRRIQGQHKKLMLPKWKYVNGDIIIQLQLHTDAAQIGKWQYLHNTIVISWKGPSFDHNLFTDKNSEYCSILKKLKTKQLRYTFELLIINVSISWFYLIKTRSDKETK